MIDTNLPWRSRFYYGTGGDYTDWSTARPVAGWEPSVPTVGGSRTAASGVPASYVVRRDHLLKLTLRVYETEINDLIALIAWGQSAETFLWYPDANDTAEYFTVYLESPLAGQDWGPTRDGDYPKTFTMPITLRNAVRVPFGLDFFACP